MAEAPKTFTAQMKNYFGYRAGDQMGDFMAEIKSLDKDDRAEFTRLLNGAGFPVIDATGK